jgi:M6 family metalloprotease-like protein
MKRFLMMLVLVTLFFGSVHAVSDEQKAQDVLKKAAANLGWPDAVTQDVDSDGNPQPQYYISFDGKGEDSDLKASIYMVPNEALSGFWLDFASEQVDFERSSYQGRDGAIMRYGKNCNPKPLVRAMNEFAVGWMESIFGESDDPDKNCVTDHGSIIWACGKYLMLAYDERSDQGGMEDDIAAGLYSAAQESGLCDFGDTLVIMADTADRPGAARISSPIKMSQKINQFYGVNSMGTLSPFKFTFRDADGSKGQNDWYHVSQPLASFPYPNGNRPFGVAAIKEAFKGADIPQDIYLERVVVVFAGNGHQSDNTAAFSNACSYFGDGDFVEVDAMQGKRKIFTKNIILMSENRDLGGWVHEFGHSLESRYANGNFFRISDRYNYDAATSPARQFGYSGPWDLMGSGSHWGAGDGDKPTQFASFTKFAAKWLESQTASLNQTYSITSLESKKKGDAILKVDDPTSANAENYVIIEARDATAFFGAPASGVVIYYVRWDGANNHHVINVMNTQSGQTWINSSQGGYTTPTLYSASPSPGSTYLIPPWQLKFVVKSVTRQPYSADVRVESYTPQNLTGAVAHPGPAPANGGTNASTTENNADENLPDMDLHAYDADGNHVGLNYQTNEYENDIPGAIASGDLVGDDEWIFVPSGMQVRYEISTYKTQQFLAKNPGMAVGSGSQNYTATAIKFDSQGRRFEGDLGGGSADPGAKIDLKSPADPSVKYEEKAIPGYGSNSSCPLLPGFLLLLAIGVFLRTKAG